jgi:hypothetical protein
MLKTRQKTCHFLPLFEVRDGHRGREFCTVCQAGTRGSELGYAGQAIPKKMWQIRAEKWHNSIALLFTIFCFFLCSLVAAR